MKKIKIILISILALFFTPSCKDKQFIAYEKLISILENGDEIEIKNLLWQPECKKIEYAPSVIASIQKLKTENHNLSIFKKLDKNNYELIIFNMPWKKDFPYSPIIINKVDGKIVGIMLQFDELHDKFSEKDNSDIGDLGMQWVNFVMAHKYK
jgi:hypothetical protein